MRRTAASVAALLQTKADSHELVGTQGVQQIADDQAAARRFRGERKRAVRRTVAELVQGSHNSVVLHHLQPRWLRAAALAWLDRTGRIDEETITLLRERGP